MQHHECTGCNHCLNCLPCALTYELCDATRRSQVDEPYQPWWPASIASPTLYFHLKRRAMEFQFREQARTLPYSDPSVWRSSSSSAAAGAPNQLLCRRGKRQLSLRLPAGRTNMTAGDELELLGVLHLQATATAAAAAAPAAAAAAAPQPMAVQQQAQPVSVHQPLQHTHAHLLHPHHHHHHHHHQACSSADAASCQQQQPTQPTHTVVRPQPRRSAPLHLSSLQQLQLPLQQLEAAHQQQQQQLGLLTSLHRQEQYYQQQQQLAASAVAAAASCAAAAGEVHPAAWLRPTLPCAWDQQQQHQVQLQQMQHIHQQQQVQMAAVVEAAAWPYALQQPQHTAWAFASSLEPMPAC